MNERTRVLIKKSTIQKDSAPTAATPVAGSTAPRPHSDVSCARPEVVLHKNGDDIEAIEITCPCGHVMILDCEYKTA